MRGLVLITGGAGFIGAHLARELLDSGYHVRILDDLTPQVHGREGWPAYMPRQAEAVEGDIRDPEAVRHALRGCDHVCHLAARVGVGQSMYEIAGYTAVNDLGTAVLLEALAGNPVKRLLVASSMSIYGEGLYRAGDRLVEPREREASQLRAGQWELRLATGELLEPVPTPESKSPSLTSFYALGKYSQEQMALIFGRAYGVEAVALRFFNVYGPWQALSNPYTGVLAIFAARLLNHRPPLLFEDGGQRRDFVHVRDVARACRLALEAPAAPGRAINIGSGESRSVLQVAEALGAATGKPFVSPHVLGKYRAGDIRHCFADISLARRVLGFEPKVAFAQGLAELAEWLEGQIAIDGVDHANAELSRRGLVA